MPSPALTPEREEIVHRLLREQNVDPRHEHVLGSTPRGMSVFRYLLRIRTNIALIVAIALGYFFLGGARTFGVVFVRGHYHLGQAAGTALSAVLGVGALVGVLVGGRVADRLLHRGHLNARIGVSAIAYLAAALLFVPPIVISSLAIALPLYVLATAALIAPSAPQDAAVLDVIPGPLWGRGEGLLTAFRTFGQALAPVLFGFLADVLGSTSSHRFGTGTFRSTAASGAQGLEVTFLIMLAPIALAGFVLLRARRWYPGDVATATESERRLRSAAGNGG
jgi:MFS family permease